MGKFDIVCRHSFCENTVCDFHNFRPLKLRWAVASSVDKLQYNRFIIETKANVTWCFTCNVKPTLWEIIHYDRRFKDVKSDIHIRKTNKMTKFGVIDTEVDSTGLPFGSSTLFGSSVPGESATRRGINTYQIKYTSDIAGIGNKSPKLCQTSSCTLAYYPRTADSSC